MSIFSWGGGDFEKYELLDCVPSFKEKYNDLQLYIFFWNCINFARFFIVLLYEKGYILLNEKSSIPLLWFHCGKC